MSTSATPPLAPVMPFIPAGVKTPVFWGSFLGILIGSIMAGLSYLGVFTDATEIAGAAGSPDSPPIHPIIVLFCCLLCVRYYASIIFLTYDDVTSPRIEVLEQRARKTIFTVQFFLIVGCSLNIAVLPVFGSTAATAIIVAQASSLIPYWRSIWSSVIAGPQSDFRLLLVLGDFTILGSAVIFLTWELGVFPYDEKGAGFCLGAIAFVFIGETITTYRRSLVVFIRSTLASLR